MLEAHDLAAGYGGRPVISDINITLPAGRVVALLGANGAGKTTTILTLAGEISPLRGHVAMMGHPTRAPLYRRARRGLRLVTEERSVFMGMSARDNLKLAGRDIRGSLEIFPELERVLGRRAGLLSGGEQQMLTLGRALAARPKVILIDELSLGLAPLIVERLLLAVRTAADKGTAVLLVEQQMRHALSVADYGCVLRHGRLVLEGTAADLLADTAKIEAHYLGDQ